MTICFRMSHFENSLHTFKECGLELWTSSTKAEHRLKTSPKSETCHCQENGGEIGNKSKLEFWWGDVSSTFKRLLCLKFIQIREWRIIAGLTNFLHEVKNQREWWEWHTVVSRLDKRLCAPEMVDAAIKERRSSFPRIENKDNKKLYELVDIMIEIESLMANPQYTVLLVVHTNTKMTHHCGSY
jgi:hypothetical protein